MAYQKLTKKEIRFILLVSLILIIITCLPYLYGYLIKGDLFYVGSYVFSSGDNPVYFSFIEQIKQGNFLLDNLFTNETEQIKLFNPFWLIIGLIAKIFKFSTFFAYQLFRIILIPIFLFVLYKFISFFLSDYSLLRKKLCFLYSLFASGLGIFSVLLSGEMSYSNYHNLSMDLWVPEASNFLILSYSPHFIASIILIILTFYFFFRAVEEKNLKLGLGAGMSALLLFSFHPFFVPTIYSITFIYLIFLFLINKKIEFKAVLNYLVLVVVSLPAVFYYFYVVLIDSFLQIKAWQNICLTPGGMIFFISYGFGLFFAVFAIGYLIKRKKMSNKNLFLIIWFCVSIILIYAPFNFQRRLTEGFQIPLTILAFIGLVISYDFLKIKSKLFKNLNLWGILPVFILLFCFSNVIVYFWNFKFLNLKLEPIYMQKEIKQALDWYKDKTGFEETILAGRINANLLPGIIGRRVYLGHWVETINYTDKMIKLNHFFKDNQDDLAKKEFLKENKIDYMLYSEEEKKMGDYDPSAKDYLKEVYKNEKVSIYKVSLD